MMAKTSAIEWTDATWNPWRGCTKVSAGCKNCYMFRDQKRYGNDPTQIVRSKTTFNDPLKWKEPLRIFVCSWSDFFHKDVPMEWMLDALEIIDQCPQHTFILLTKRPENIGDVLKRAGVFDPVKWFRGTPNIWLGVSAENQEQANIRIPILMEYPAAVRFLSIEPMLGPVNLTEAMYGPEPKGMSVFGFTDGVGHEAFIQWVIAGGESGPGCRPLDPAWVTDLRDQCLPDTPYKVPFFFKQWGGTKKENGAWGGRVLDGRTWDELPDES